MKEIALEYRKKRDEKAFLENELEIVEKDIERLKAQIIDEMLEGGITSTRIEGVGMLTVCNKLVARIINKDKFFEWLKATDRESLIKRDVNYQTLQAFANEIDQAELKAAHDAGMDYEDKVVLSLKK